MEKNCHLNSDSTLSKIIWCDTDMFLYFSASVCNHIW